MVDREDRRIFSLIFISIGTRLTKIWIASSTTWVAFSTTHRITTAKSYQFQCKNIIKEHERSVQLFPPRGHNRPWVKTRKTTNYGCLKALPSFLCKTIFKNSAWDSCVTVHRQLELVIPQCWCNLAELTDVSLKLLPPRGRVIQLIFTGYVPLDSDRLHSFFL